MNKTRTILIAVAVALAPILIIVIILTGRNFSVSEIPDDSEEIVDNNEPNDPVDIVDDEDPVDIIDDEDPADPKVIGSETLIETLVADEVIRIRGDYWSYKIGNKYGIVTTNGKIVAALYDQHFFNGVSDQICSYKNNDFVGFDFESDLNNEIECYGFGWHEEGYYYDTSKKWMYMTDMDILVKANPWFESNQSLEVIQRVVVGNSASEESTDDFSVLEEFSIVRFTKTDTSYSYSFLTDFDYTEVVKLYIDEEWQFVVKDKVGKWGLLDTNGATLIEPKYEKFVQPSGEMSLFTVVNNDKYFVINKNDEILFQSNNDEIFSAVQNSKFWIKRAGKWYIVDIKYS